jgi:hypothetical protein
MLRLEFSRVHCNAQTALTGADGLMMTLGASGCPALLGEPPALRPIIPCCPPNDAPLPVELGGPSCPDCEPAFPAALSPEGRGLLRESTSWVCDEEGVAWAELDGEFACEGDEVPELPSFFFDDFSLFPRESWSCYPC